MAEALRDAYADIFLIKETPSNSDRAAIVGKFKSYHNTTDNVAGLMAKTFLALCDMADFKDGGVAKKDSGPAQIANIPEGMPSGSHRAEHKSTPGLHYNIQIHLPATKDVEVYNAIFKSLREHLYDN